MIVIIKQYNYDTNLSQHIYYILKFIFLYQIPADTKVLKLGKHKLAIALYVPTFLAVLTLLGSGLFQALKILVKSAVTFYTQKFNVPIAKLAQNKTEIPSTLSQTAFGFYAISVSVRYYTEFQTKMDIRNRIFFDFFRLYISASHSKNDFDDLRH